MLHRFLGSALLVVGLVVWALGAGPAPRPAAAATAIIGSGSSFAGIELQEWAKDVSGPPYGLSVNYQSSSSGQGRQNFKDGVVDFAVSDIRYNKYDVSPPDPSTFAYIPVTAGGLAFMYNLKSAGFGAGTTPINLSSLGVCGIFTGAIPFWDDAAIAADNPGVHLPHVPISPVVRSDPAGTNFVLQEYCIQLHNDLYARFAAAVSKATSTDYPDEPTSTWPILTPIVAAQGSENAADTVASNNNTGAITAVETGYAIQRGFPVASVKNDTGAYVQPTDTAVSTALSYATQQVDGTHNLNFAPGDPAAYNPSTYSYLLVHTKNGDPAKGASITTFGEYALTIGQQGAPQLGYASIGRSLIQFGLNRLKDVPGYVAPTDAMLGAVPASDPAPPKSPPPAGASGGGATGGGGGSSGGATPASVGASGGAAGGPATGATGPGGAANPAAGAGSAVGGAAAGRTGGVAARSGRTSGAGIAQSTTGRSSLAAADPAASLDAGTGPLGQTGVESDILMSAGGLLLGGGELGRRLASRVVR